MAIDLDTYDGPTQYWLAQIEGAQKDCQNWYERGKGVLDRYLDKKDQALSSVHKMNVLWSNVQTIQPALYAKTPNPKVSRRYRDKDPVGKWGAVVLERANIYHFDAYDCDYNIRACILDYLLQGRGQVWISYEPQIVQGPPGPDGKPTQQLAWEYAKDEHLHWKDFLHSPARTWDEVWWVAKRGFLTKDEVKAHPLLSKNVDKLSFTDKKDEDADNKGERVKKAAIWCIWSKAHKKVIYVSKTCPEILAETDPPIEFENFFPCPRPLTTTTTTDSVIPTPDYCQYQNQAEEIDRLTQRINLLTDALRVVGIYDAGLDGDNPGSGLIANVLQNKGVNEMIPVASFAMIAGSGGMKSAVDFFPLDMVINTLNECYAAREQAKATMYEITGISDIVRGASDPNETARAQQIKSQWGSLRIRDRQAEVQRFVRDILRLKTEIMAEHFQLETLKAMTNCPILMQKEKQALSQRKQIAGIMQQAQQMPPEQVQAFLQANPQFMPIIQQVQANPALAAPLTLEDEQKLKEPTWEEVYQLLKDQKLRSYRIDIETDSTIQVDEAEEKQARIEFVTAVTSFAQAWGPMIGQDPRLAPLACSLLTFAARGFKQSESIEAEIDAFADMMSQQAMMGPPPQEQPPVDPNIAAQGEVDGAKYADAEKQRQHEAVMADKKMQMTKADAEAKAMVEQAKRPSAEELQPVIAPLVAIMQQMAQQMASQQQAQNEAVMNAVAQLAQLAAAPKEVVIKRGADGRVSGGVAVPRMN